ncbi:MAG: hypothetical protein AAGB97_06655 [Dehalococcoidia bacterium]|nr:hypothetical protein [Chloroflexota bacterium]MBT9161508.1 hypothetical protein [Chloroflexota bacterium]
MIVDQEFIEARAIKTYIVEEKFTSRKNNVYKISSVQHNGNKTRFVVKIYKGSPNNMQKELSLLQKLNEKGLTVPVVYYAGTNNFIMEYLAGPHLLTVICRQEEIATNKNAYIYRSNYQLIRSLFCWLNNFYALAKEIIGENIILEDINLRNFILKNDKIYGFDLEDYSTGEKERDAGRFGAFLLTYVPSFTVWKTDFVKEMFQVLKEFNYNELLVRQEMEKEFTAINKRRGLEVSLKTRHAFLGNG